MLTCAIMMYLTVNVGRVINMDMKTALDSQSNRALGFLVLIIQLCHLRRVDGISSNPTDSIRLQPMITEKLYVPGEKVKRDQRRAASEDEAEDWEMDTGDDQGHRH